MRDFIFRTFSVILFIQIFFSGCSSSEQSAQTKKPTGENIPPGSAIIKCEFLTSQNEADFYLLNVKVTEVLGYGSATETIAAGTDMKLQLNKSLMEIKSLKKGTELNLQIRQPKTALENNKNGNWTVVQIIK